MRDGFSPDDQHDDGLFGASRYGSSARPFADREVPLSPPPAALADAVHAWLDGEGSEDSARRLGSVSDVDFWKRLEGAIAPARWRSASLSFEERVMQAIRRLDY